MEIEFITWGLVADLKVKSGNAVIKEDIAEVKNGVGFIHDDVIEKFLTIARDMHIYSGGSDVEFVKMVYDAFLNTHDRSEFLEIVS